MENSDKNETLREITEELCYKAAHNRYPSCQALISAITESIEGRPAEEVRAMLYWAIRDIYSRAQAVRPKNEITIRIISEIPGVTAQATTTT